MEYNYGIYADDGRLVKASHYTSLAKSAAVREARGELDRGVGAYALITAFDWRRGHRAVGRIDARAK
jgi:hypothetical protein